MKMIKRISIWIFLVIAIFGCKPEEKGNSKPPNIVWLVSEDNSVHYLKLYSAEGASMPTIEALAKNGNRLQQHFFKRPGLLGGEKHHYFWLLCP